jgi:hypothetical protein
MLSGYQRMSDARRSAARMNGIMVAELQAIRGCSESTTAPLSGLLMRIAAMGSVTVVRTDERLTAFMEARIAAYPDAVRCRTMAYVASRTTYYISS